jgi:hypothetical protein
MVKSEKKKKLARDDELVAPSKKVKNTHTRTRTRT